MTAISQTTFLMYFHEWKVCILIRILHKFVPNGPIDNDSALVQVMACAEQATGHYLIAQAITWANADPVHWRIYVARNWQLKCFSTARSG